MHMQPIFQNCDVGGGAVAEALFRDGLCLPSGSSLTREQQDTVIASIEEARSVTPTDRVAVVRA